MYKEIPHFHAFLSLFSRVSCVWGMSLGNGMGAERGPVREKGGECGDFCRAAGPVGGVRGEYGFPEVLSLSPVRGGGACPVADEKCHRGNIKKEQKVEFPVPYTWGICPESGVPVPEYFSGRGIPLFVVGVAAAGAVGVIPFCPLLHSALWKKLWVPPLRRSMSGNEIHCALSRADR